MKRIILCAVICAPLVGCTNMAKFARELGKDNATVIGDINTVYGRGKFTRLNPPPGSKVTITADGSVTMEVPATNAPVVATARKR